MFIQLKSTDLASEQAGKLASWRVAPLAVRWQPKMRLETIDQGSTRQALLISLCHGSYDGLCSRLVEFLSLS